MNKIEILIGTEIPEMFSFDNRVTNIPSQQTIHGLPIGSTYLRFKYSN